MIDIDVPCKHIGRTLYKNQLQDHLKSLRWLGCRYSARSSMMIPLSKNALISLNWSEQLIFFSEIFRPLHCVDFMRPISMSVVYLPYAKQRGFQMDNRPSLPSKVPNCCENTAAKTENTIYHTEGAAGTLEWYNRYGTIPMQKFIRFLVGDGNLISPAR